MARGRRLRPSQESFVWRIVVTYARICGWSAPKVSEVTSTSQRRSRSNKLAAAARQRPLVRAPTTARVVRHRGSEGQRDGQAVPRLGARRPVARRQAHQHEEGGEQRVDAPRGDAADPRQRRLLIDTLLLSYPGKRYRSAWLGIAVHSAQPVFIGALALTLVV